MADYINPYKLFVGSFLPNWILENENISKGAMVCYARLCQYAGKDGKCFPSQKTLAEELKCSDRSIRIYLSELVSEKLISIVRTGGASIVRFLYHQDMSGGQKGSYPIGQEFPIRQETDCLSDRKKPAYPYIRRESIKRIKEDSSSNYSLFEEKFFLSWNKLAAAYPTALSGVLLITKDRRVKIKVRYAEKGFVENIEEAIDLIAKSKFLLGENDRRWVASFDWLIENNTNYAKILEGKYKAIETEADKNKKGNEVFARFIGRGKA